MARCRRKPHDPARAERERTEDAKRQASARRLEDAALRAQGICPKTARWNDDPMDGARVEALERQGFKVVRADSDAARNPGVSTVATDHRGRQIKASHKADIWQQLFTRGALTRDQLNAVRNLQDLMAKRAGVGGRDEEKAITQVRVDDCRDPCLTSDAMQIAGVEMDLTLQFVGPPSQRVLTSVLWPAVLCEPFDWRESVLRAAPWAKNPMAQSALLVNAAEALLNVRPQVVKAMKERAEQKGRARRAADERADPQGLALA